MVWQYEESYPGCPYLADWVAKEFNFGIELSESVLDRTIEKTEVGKRAVQVIETETKGTLEPRFYMAGNKNDRPYQLSLDLIGGLARRVITTIGDGKIGSFNVIDLRTRRLGTGGFEDLKSIGNYAVERLPKIAQEVVLPPSKFSADIPDNVLIHILEYRDQCLSVLNWETTQKEICRRFASLFGTYVLAARGKPGVGLIGRRGDDKFTAEEIRELSELVKSLR